MASILIFLFSRYFDLRLATKNGQSNFYFTHGVYAEEISKGLEEVKRFVETHPGEVCLFVFFLFVCFIELCLKLKVNYRTVYYKVCVTLFSMAMSKLCKLPAKRYHICIENRVNVKFVINRYGSSHLAY